METTTPVPLNFVRNAFGDEYLYEVNRNAFDREGSNAIYNRMFDPGLRQQDALYLVVGTDSGLLLEWLLREELPEGSRYLFIEPAVLIDSIRSRFPQLAELPRVRLETPESWAEQQQAFQFQDYAYLERIRTIQSVAAADAHLAEYRRISWEIDAFVKAFTWRTEYKVGSQTFVQTQIVNIPDNRTPASILKGCLEGKTAVLLGGGPSLDELLPWVKQHRDKLAVFAVSRIAKRLLQVGLKPDIVASIDPHHLSFDASKEMLDFDDPTVLVHSYHISPPLLAQWRGASLYMGERLPWKSKLNLPNVPTHGPTVTNTALWLAVEMGIEQIVLGGVDLCFTQEGYTHALGSTERGIGGARLGTVGIQVETNGGWMADTDHAMASAVASIEEQARLALDRGCRIINPAPGAARIPHIEHMALADIALPVAPCPVAKIIHGLIPDNSASQRIKHYQAMLKEIARENGRLRAIAGLADQALECNDGLFGRNGKTADFKYKKRMDKIEKRLDREYKDISPLVKNYASRAFLRLVRPDKERDWTDEDIERWGQAYYQVYKKSAQAVLGLLEDAREHIQSRLLEESDTAEIQTLIERWQRDDIPGRALVWQKQHPEICAHLPQQQQRALNEMQQQFRKVIDNTDTELAKSYQKHFDLNPVRSKLQILFQQGEREELAQTAQELQKQDSPQAQHLVALAHGYLAEIDGDADHAMSAYQTLVDFAADHLEKNNGELPDSKELEDALRHMSGIALSRQDSAQAMVLMEVLTTISPSYLPQYAELHKLSGDLKGAIDAYHRYLDYAPNDHGALIKLGQIFEIAGAIDSARWAYQHVLQSDPENKAARSLHKRLESLG